MKTQNVELEIVIAELEKTLSVLQANYQQAVSNLHILRQCVDTDDLTLLMRRGAFMRKFEGLLLSSQKDGRQVQLMMIDVDHFKKVNDAYGHQTGDAVLEKVSELIRAYLRPQDLAGRYGGEEIIVAMQAGPVEAQLIAENIRKAVEAHRMISVSSPVPFAVTLSVGVASTHEFGFEAGALIAHADKALYKAKQSGRNQVVRADGKDAAVLAFQRAERVAA